MRSILLASAIALAASPSSAFSQCPPGATSCPTAPMFSAPANFAPLPFQEIYPSRIEIVQSAPVVEHEMKDANGKAWLHRDRKYLAGWIAARNEAIQAERKAKKAVPVPPPAAPLHNERQPKATIDLNEESIPPYLRDFASNAVLAGGDIEMSAGRRLPAYAKQGVDRDRISVAANGDKYTTNDHKEGDRLIEDAKNLTESLKKNGGSDKKPDLKDDTDKPYVAIIASKKEDRERLLKDFEPGGPLEEWKDKVHLKAMAPDDWKAKDVGIVAKGDPGVVVFQPNKRNPSRGKVVLNPEKYSPEEVDSTLRRINPHYDPNKVPSGGGFLERLFFAQFLSSHGSQLLTIAWAIFLFVCTVIGIVVLIAMAYAIPSKR